MRGCHGLTAVCGAFKKPEKREGQVLIELMLILPTFMLIMFFIMELGNLAFQVILANHGAYEIARIGSLVAGPTAGKSGYPNLGLAKQKMKSTLCKFFPSCGKITMQVKSEMTSVDPQSGQTNEDLIVSLVYPAKLVFPGSRYFLASEPRKNGIRKVNVEVRMPIEKPYSR